jgi:hypothetical protein
MRARWGEIYQLLLMEPYYRMEVLLVQERQMGKGAEPAIGHEHVAGLSGRMPMAHMGHVVRVARRRQDLQEEPRPRMKQSEEVPDREPTPRLLPWRGTTGGLELWSIGHGKPGPIHQEGAVAVPASFLLGYLIQGATDLPQHLLPDAQREPAAGLAKGRRRKLLPGQMWEMATGRVPMEDLEDAEVDGGHRIEDAMAPRVA